MPRTLTSRVAGTVLLAAFVGGASLQLAPHRAAAQPGRADSNTLIVDYKDDISHLDTALCYDTECYPFMRLMYDRLLDYNTKVGRGTT